MTKPDGWMIKFIEEVALTVEALKDDLKDSGSKEVISVVPCGWNMSDGQIEIGVAISVGEYEGWAVTTDTCAPACDFDRRAKGLSILLKEVFAKSSIVARPYQ